MKEKNFTLPFTKLTPSSMLQLADNILSLDDIVYLQKEESSKKWSPQIMYENKLEYPKLLKQVRECMTEYLLEEYIDKNKNL